MNLRVALAVPAAVMFAACARPEGPRVEGPLAIDVPELCTVCVEVLRCRGADSSVVYVLHRKGAWAQIATIWDYAAGFVRPKTEDFRRLSTLTVDGADAVIARVDDERARLDVWRRRIELPGAMIDQTSADWIDADGSVRGRCEHLERDAGLALAARLGVQA